MADPTALVGRVTAMACGAERPVQGARVATLDRLDRAAVTDPDGGFRLAGVAPRYDLVAVVPRPLVCGRVPPHTSTARDGVEVVIVHDLTRRDPRLRVDVMWIEEKHDATLTARVAGATEGETTLVAPGARGFDHVSSGLRHGAFWLGPPEIDATLHVLAFEPDAQGRAKRFLGVGSVPTHLHDAGEVETNVALAPVATRTLHVALEGVPAGTTPAFTLAAAPADGASIALQRAGSAWSERATDVPVPAGMPVVAHAWFDDAGSWSQGEARVPADASSVVVRLPPPLVAHFPDEHGGVGHATTFAWTEATDGAPAPSPASRVVELFARVDGAQPSKETVHGYKIVTTRGAATIPDLSALGARAPRPHLMGYWVLAVHASRRGTAARTDDVAAGADVGPGDAFAAWTDEWRYKLETSL